MKQRLTSLFFYLFIGLQIIGCGGGSSPDDSSLAPIPPEMNSDTASVYQSATFNVEVTTDIKYGEGLSHANWNSDNYVTTDLLLDVYMPENDASRRPVIVFIHGGGFISGSKEAASAYRFLHYFAERGFVGFSINYRLQRDYGTLPSAFNAQIDNVTGLTQPQRDQIKAIYPAVRDAKAAIRWINANSDQYRLDTDHITVTGGSAGSIISVALGITDESDYFNELNTNEDNSLSSTNLNMPSKVHTVIDHWGSGAAVELINAYTQEDRYDASDVPVSIVHGTEDPTVLFEEALALRDNYARTGAYYEFYPIEGAGHGPWNARIDGMSLEELAFQFVLTTQDLKVVE